MNRFSLPLLTWVILALALVVLLPFATSAYQIRASRIATVDQVQTVHLSSSRAAADRVAWYLELLTAVGTSAAENPNLYADPGSAMAREVLTGLVLSRPEILAAGVYLVAGDALELIQVAQQSEHRETVERTLHAEDPRPLIAEKDGDGLWIRRWLPIATVEAAAGELALFLVVDGRSLVEYFDLVELGDEAEVVLAARGGEVLAPAGSSLAGFPEALVAAARAGLVRSGSGEYRAAAGERTVGAWSEVDGSPWFVLSRQPSEVAETATRRLRATAWRAFGATAALAAVLAFAAHFTVVRPIRRLVQDQRRLAGLAAGPVRGGEIAQLKESFAQIGQNLHDREALGKVFLGRYQVIDVLGVGAMGTVFRGWDPRLERHVALKTLKIGRHLDPEERQDHAERLVKEAVTLARLQHPNIVAVFDVVQEGDAAFIAMELVAGESLERHLWRHKRLAADQAVPLAVSLLRALEAAHGREFVHHDVKPGNILLAADGAIKVTDFGVSEMLTSAHAQRDVVCGTPGYLAPEALLRQGYGPKSDLFAAGVVLYESLTGRRPFRGATTREVLIETATGQVVPPRSLVPEISPELEALILGLLDKDPDQRPEIGAMLEALERMASAEGWRWSSEGVGQRAGEERTDDSDRPRTSLVLTLDSVRRR